MNVPLFGQGLLIGFSIAAPVGPMTRGGLLGAYLSTFFLTLTNPMTILSFVAVFAGLGLGSQARGVAAASTLVAGVFVGSAAWWLLLSALVAVTRERVTAGALRWVNRLSGAIIVAFGIAALWSAARSNA